MNINISKISLENMVLPVFDIVLATPIYIHITDKKNLIFKIPSVDEYFKFEHQYIKILATYFELFSNVSFLEYKDFKKVGMKKKMLVKVMKLMQIKSFKMDFLKIIQKYFKADFNIRRLYKVINPMQMGYLFLFVHKVIETIKKKLIESVKEVDGRILVTSSTSSKVNSTKIEPRY